MRGSVQFKQVFAAACLGMLMVGIVLISLGATLPMLISKFNLSEIQAGVLTSLLPAGILVGSLLFGPVVDRYSYKYLLLFCALAVAAGMEAIAFTDNYWWLQVFVFFIGVGGGAVNGGTNALVADISAEKPERRSANLSLLGVFYGLGALGMPFLMGALTENYGFETILKITGVALLVPGILFGITRFPQPKQGQSIPLERFFKMAKDLNILLLGFFLFFQSGIEGIISNWAPVVLESRGYFLQSEALFGLSIFVFSLTATRVLLAIILGRIRPYAILSASVAVIVLGILLLMVSESSTQDIIGLIFMGAGLAAGFPVVLGYVGDLYKELSGTAFSLVFVIALLGNIIANYLMGAVSQAYGLSKFTILLLTGTICLAGVMIWSLNRIKTLTRI